MTYAGWAIIGLFLICHWWLHGIIHRWACVDENDNYLDIPFPLWVHLLIAPPALLLTLLIVWMVGALI